MLIKGSPGPVPWLTHLRLDKMALIENILKCIILENDKIRIQISQKLVPRSPIDNKPAFVHIMACRRAGDKSLPKPMITQLTDA